MGLNVTSRNFLIVTYFGPGWSKQLPALKTGGRSVPFTVSVHGEPCFPGRNGHIHCQTESPPISRKWGPDVPPVTPACSLIAFKACDDLGLGPQVIVAGCSNIGKKQAAVERGGTVSAGALFGHGINEHEWPPQASFSNDKGFQFHRVERVLFGPRAWN